MKENTNINGRVTVRLEDPQGNILQEETHENTLTNPFLLSSLSRMATSAPMVNPWVSGDKSSLVPSGQYMSNVTTGTWGIYAMANQAPITKGTCFPPYTDTANTLNSDVTFYCNNGNTLESAREMSCTPQRSGYAIEKDENSITVEYVKSTGVGTVRSVIFGRSFADPNTYTGMQLGEFAQVPGWSGAVGGNITVAARAGCAVEHKPDRTRIWRTSASTAAVWDFKTKLIDQYTGSQMLPDMNLTATNLFTVLTSDSGNAAGTLVMDGHPWRVEYTTNAAGTSVTYILIRFKDAASPVAADKKTIVVPITAGTTVLTQHPVIVARPDNHTIEVFCAVSHGKFTVNSTDKYGINVKKIVLSSLAGNVADVITSTADLGILQIAPSAYSQYSALGFYDADLEQYWLPCMRKADPVTGAPIDISSSSTFAPGYIFKASDMSIVGEWISRYSGDAIAPVKTDVGIVPVIYAGQVPTYYAKVSQVMSGVVLTQDFTKTANNVLRIIYTYTLT